MEGSFEVRQGGRVAGKVQVIAQGLYVRIICRCQIEGSQVYRLFAISGSHQENLGVLVPDGDGFLLDKRIPAKRLGQGISFYLSAGSGHTEGKFIPICPEEPFAYIDRLKTAFLESQGEIIGVRIKNYPEAM